jgi:hypothetical protein
LTYKWFRAQILYVHFWSILKYCMPLLVNCATLYLHKNCSGITFLTKERIMNYCMSYQKTNDSIWVYWKLHTEYTVACCLKGRNIWGRANDHPYPKARYEIAMTTNSREQSVASQQLIGQQFGKHTTAATDSRGNRRTVRGGDYYSVRLEITRKKPQSASVYDLQSTTLDEEFATKSSQDRSSQEVKDKEFRRVQEPQTRLLLCVVKL